MIAMEDLPAEVVAQALGIPVGTVWTRLHHARKRAAGPAPPDRGQGLSDRDTTTQRRSGLRDGVADQLVRVGSGLPHLPMPAREPVDVVAAEPINQRWWLDAVDPDAGKRPRRTVTFSFTASTVQVTSTVAVIGAAAGRCLGVRDLLRPGGSRHQMSGAFVQSLHAGNILVSDLDGPGQIEEPLPMPNQARAGVLLPVERAAGQGRAAHAERHHALLAAGQRLHRFDRRLRHSGGARGDIDDPPSPAGANGDGEIAIGLGRLPRGVDDPSAIEASDTEARCLRAIWPGVCFAHRCRRSSHCCRRRC